MTQLATNMEKWKQFMRNIPSPDSFIEAGLYSMVSAALQRRVWLWTEEDPIFPNMFILLVGKPSTGKGRVIGPVTDMLRFHKLKENEVFDTSISESYEALVKRIEDTMYQTEFIIIDPKNNKQTRSNLVIPVGSNSGTYEGLVRASALAYRSIKLPPDIAKQYRTTKGNFYVHKSIVAIVEEAATLFKEKSNKMIDFLTTAWDCKYYEHDTKTQGTDRLDNLCFSLLAGTNPDFMKEAFSNRYLNQGFASRCVVVFEERPRFHKFNQADIENKEERLRLKAEITAHLLYLSKLFGNVRYSPSAWEFMQDVVENKMKRELDEGIRINRAPQLDGYYGRKRSHLEKLAMAIHFSENLDMIIQLESCVRALEFLEEREQNMDKALITKGRNELADVHEKCIRIIREKGQTTRMRIWTALIEDIKNEGELNDMLNFLENAGRIRTREDEDTGKLMYMLGEEEKERIIEL
jgi:hypothetical protein